jgi:hypothetical protein
MIPLRSLRIGALACAGCSGVISGRVADETYRVMRAARDAAASETDVEIARTAWPAGIVQLDGFVRAYPDHRGMRELRAETVCQYATAVGLDDWEAAVLERRDATKLAARGLVLAARCEAAALDVLGPRWRDARGLAAMTARVPETDDAAGLLWLGVAETCALAIDPLHHLGALALADAALTRSAALAPGLADATAALTLASLHAATSKLLGGDDGTAALARARIATGGRVLLVEVVAAHGAAIAHGDRAGFEATLRQVLAADLARWPEHRMVNELAVRKARRYLDHAEVVFE